MLNWKLSEMHAVTILKKDHAAVKEIFDQFEKADTPAGRKRLINRALTELKIHATIEEEIFYPAVRRQVGEKLMNEAGEEHHVAKVLIAELEQLPKQDGIRDAKFTVLAENVRHHIKEEEGEMLPKAVKLDMDFEQLGQRLLDRKKQLLRDGVPIDAEHTMVAKAGRNADSPANAAKNGARTNARQNNGQVRTARAGSRTSH